MFGSVPAAASAQSTGGGPASRDAWFPDGGPFAPPLADPLEPRFGVGLIRTDLLVSAAGADVPPYLPAVPEGGEVDVQGVANIGGTLRLWRTAGPDRDAAGAAGAGEVGGDGADGGDGGLAGGAGGVGGGVAVGVQAGVFARFRMEEPSRHAVATDWVVALPVEAALGAVSGRVRLLHRSAHLGDELIEANGARRIEFGHEAVELLVAYRHRGLARLYGGGAWIFRSNTDDTRALRRRGRADRAVLRAGFEAAAHPWAGGRVGGVAAVDWKAAERTGWRSA
ncbi:MAG: DUF1207 domain-containing protein, partial [Gemmatimonadota bacterium]